MKSGTISKNLFSQAGYTLYLVVMVLSIGAILFGITLRGAGFARVMAAKRVQAFIAQSLAMSGIERAEFFFNGGDGHDMFWETDNFHEQIAPKQTIDITCKRFGGFSRIHSTGTSRRTSRNALGLAGRTIPEMLNPVLTLTGRIGGLVVDAGTTIRGPIVLHHGTMKKGPRRARAPKLQKQVTYRESEPYPFDVEPLQKNIEQLEQERTRGLSADGAISGTITIDSTNDSLCNRKPLVILGDCIIKAVTLHNPVIVVAGEFSLDAGAVITLGDIKAEHIELHKGRTEKCLFYSAGVLIMHGGDHNSQCFSQDSMVIKKKATSGVASLFVCQRTPTKSKSNSKGTNKSIVPQAASPGNRSMVGTMTGGKGIAVQNKTIRTKSDMTLTEGIRIESQSLLQGTFLCFRDTNETKFAKNVSPSLVIGKGTIIDGCIITDGAIDLQEVTMRGHIYARYITTVRDIGYTNWLFGCKLQPLEKKIVFPLLGSPPLEIVMMGMQ